MIQYKRLGSDLLEKRRCVLRGLGKADNLLREIEKSRKRRKAEHFELGFLKMRADRGQLLVHGLAVNY